MIYSLRRGAVPFGINYFFLAVCGAVLNPYLPILLQAKGFSLSQVGILLGIGGVAGIVGPVVFGRIADASHQFRLLAFFAICFCALMLSLLHIIPGFVVAVIFTSFIGISYKSIETVLTTHFGIVHPDPVGNYGKIRVFSSMGFIVSSAVFATLQPMRADSSISIVRTFLVASALYGAVLFLLPAAPRSQQRVEPKKGDTGFPVSFYILILVIFLGRFSMSAHYSFFSIFLREKVGFQLISVYWALGSVAEIPAIFYSDRIIRRMGVSRTLHLSLIAISVRLLLYAFFPHRWVVLAAQLLHAFTLGTFHTASVSFIYSRIGSSNRGVAFALYSSLGIGLSLFLGSWIGGIILESYGFRVLFSLFSLPTLLGMGILFVSCIEKPATP